MRARTVVTVAATVILGGTVALLAALAFLFSGIYDIAASGPHTSVERWFLTTLKHRSVSVRADAIEPPPLDDPARIRRGLAVYRRACVTCHGAPGQPRSSVGIGVNPNPPPLVDVLRRFDEAETYWIVANGLKMAGMPAFSLSLPPEDLWAVTAFVARMQTLSPREYAEMVAAEDGRIAPERVRWIAGDPGWTRLRAVGDPRRGREHVQFFGCGGCHRIPGLEAAQGLVGPPLAGWAKRHYIAGVTVNTPANLVTWIMDPQRVNPGTAMIDTGVDEAQAWDIAAYLYTLERE